MIILLVLFLIIMPYLVGQIVRRVLDYTGRGMVDAYLCGVMAMFMVSGVLQFLFLFMKRPFSNYEKVFPLILGVLAFAGIVVVAFDVKSSRSEQTYKERFLGFWRSYFQSKESQIFSVGVVVLLVLCAVRILTMGPNLIGDFTLETVRTTLATDSIYQYNSFTGQIIEQGMPIRQQILTLPFFLAFLSDVFDVDANMLLYKIFPCYVLFLTILVYCRWAGVLFAKQREKQSGFLLVICMLLLVGDYARLAPASLVLHQGFTGNAVCAAVVIPYAIYLCMKKKWLLACLCVGAELFLIWTTYGFGYCVWVIFLFAILEIGGKLIKERK